jgi:hypothetical protein
MHVTDKFSGEIIDARRTLCILAIIIFTEQFGVSSNVSDLHSGDTRFETLTVLIKILPCSQYFQQIPGPYLELGHGGSLPRPFKFIICYHPIISRCMFLMTDNMVK